MVFNFGVKWLGFGAWNGVEIDEASLVLALGGSRPDEEKRERDWSEIRLPKEA